MSLSSSVTLSSDPPREDCSEPRDSVLRRPGAASTVDQRPSESESLTSVLKRLLRDDRADEPELGRDETSVLRRESCVTALRSDSASDLSDALLMRSSRVSVPFRPKAREPE